MSNFQGRVKKVTSKQTDQDKTETIVIISGDSNCSVSQVKVIYPSDLNPSVTPVECSYSDILNGDRIFTNDTLMLDPSVGKSAKLQVIMEDVNHMELGRRTVDVTIEKNYL
jgi:hypothetical protein